MLKTQGHTSRAHGHMWFRSTASHYSRNEAVAVEACPQRRPPASDTAGSRSNMMQGRTWHVSIPSTASQQHKHHVASMPRPWRDTCHWFSICLARKQNVRTSVGSCTIRFLQYCTRECPRPHLFFFAGAVWVIAEAVCSLTGRLDDGFASIRGCAHQLGLIRVSHQFYTENLLANLLSGSPTAIGHAVREVSGLTTTSAGMKHRGG